MAGVVPAEYRAVVLEQQRALAKLVHQAGVGPTKKLYDKMLADLEAKLRRTATGTLTHLQARGMLAQVKLGMARVLQAMKGQFAESATTIGIEQATRALRDVARLERQFTGALVELPLLETARLSGLIEGQVSSVLRVHDASMGRYGVHLVNRFEETLGTAISRGDTPDEAISAVTEVGQMEWWRGERIVRTELAYSTNRSARAAIEEQSEELGGDLWIRWCEHVTDGGQPMDDRVGVDSEAMHGQVAPPGGKFTQPPRSPKGEEVGESLAGEEFLCPPNRPNDRAVLVPWRPHWGVPGWLWRDGRRVPATEAVVRAAVHWRPRPAPEVEVAQAAPEPSVVVVPDEPKKNPRRVEAGRRAGEASAERTREIHSAVKSNLPSELLVAWNKEGHKFLRQEGGRIRGIKDPINAASKISEAFAETYGSGAETTFGNEGDRFFKRAELDAEHAESWADEQERKYYAAAQREATEGGEITESGRARVEAAKRDHQPPSADDDDDTPF